MKIRGSYNAFKLFMEESARKNDPLVFTTVIQAPHVVELIASYDNATGVWVIWDVAGEISAAMLLEDFKKAILVATIQ